MVSSTLVVGYLLLTDTTALRWFQGKWRRKRTFAIRDGLLDRVEECFHCFVSRVLQRAGLQSTKNASSGTRGGDSVPVHIGVATLSIVHGPDNATPSPLHSSDAVRSLRAGSPSRQIILVGLNMLGSTPHSPGVPFPAPLCSESRFKLLIIYSTVLSGSTGSLNLMISC